MFDVAHRHPGKFDQFGHAHDAVAQERRACRLECDIAAAAHCHADIGCGKCGCVVDAVANHGDFAFAFELVYQFEFVFGQQFGTDADAQIFGDGVAGAGVVSGQHHGFHAHAGQCGDARLRVASRFVTDGEQAKNGGVLEQQHDCFSVRLECFDLCFDFCFERGQACHVLGAADGKGSSLERGDGGFALNRTRVCYGGCLNSQAAGVLHDGQRERMARGIFDGGGDAQQFRLEDSKGHHVGHFWFARGQRAGFVERHAGHASDDLEHLTTFDQNAAPSTG